MKVEVINTQGAATGRSVELPDEIFGVEPNEHVVYLSVKQYLAHQRQGTHKSKERGEIAGSTKKIKRQKGTGTARAGTMKSPVFVGGGRAFGPRPRKYTVRLNKKVKSLAQKSALSDKAANGNLIVVEDFSFDAPKTKEFVSILRNINANDQKTLFVTSDVEKEVYLSARNLPKTNVVPVNNINVYTIVDAAKLVLSESAVERIKENLA